MSTKNICELARTIRSKNAGISMITLEIIFDDKETYTRVKGSGVISRELIARLYNVTAAEILDFMFFDPGYAVKASIRRSVFSGGPKESDIYGCQQYVPLFKIEIPWKEE